MHMHPLFFHREEMEAVAFLSEYCWTHRACIPCGGVSINRVLFFVLADLMAEADSASAFFKSSGVPDGVVSRGLLRMNRSLSDIG